MASNIPPPSGILGDKQADTIFDGNNAIYLEQLYARFKTGDASLDSCWHNYFALLDAADTQSSSNNGAECSSSPAEGAAYPSWQRADWPPQRNGELTAALDGYWADIDGDDKAASQQMAGKLRRLMSGADEAAIRAATLDSVRAIMMIRAYRFRGHLAASLDPLGLEPPRTHPELHPTSYGFTPEDYARPIFIDNVLGLETATINEMLAILRRTYCGDIAFEFMHISNPEEKSWLQERMEGADKGNQFYGGRQKGDFSKTH